jgi:hypothetical protein
MIHVQHARPKYRSGAPKSQPTILILAVILAMLQIRMPGMSLVRGADIMTKSGTPEVCAVVVLIMVSGFVVATRHFTSGSQSERGALVRAIYVDAFFRCHDHQLEL